VGEEVRAIGPIEPGRTYALVVDHPPRSSEELQQIKERWQEATAAKCVVLSGLTPTDVQPIIPDGPTIRDNDGHLTVEWPTDERPEWFAITPECFQMLIDRINEQVATLARVRRYAHWLRQHQGVTGLTEGAALLRVLDEGWSPDDLPEPF